MSTPSRAKIAAIGFMGVTGLGFTVIMPLLVGAIVDELQLDRSMVGWLASANIAGLTFGALIATLLIGRVRLTHIIRLGCIGLLLLDFLSTFITDQNVLLILRLISGIAGGMVYAASLATFSGLKNSVSAFSTYIICYTVTSGLALLVLPHTIGLMGYKSGFYLLCLMDLASLLSTGIIAHFEKLTKPKNFESLAKLITKPVILASLVSYFLMQLGGGLIYTYCERIGREAGLGVEYIGIVLSLGSIAAFGGAFIVTKIGNRYGTRKPVTIGISLMIFFFLTLFWSEHRIVYLIALGLGGAAWSLAMPFYQQLQVSFDPRGKIVSVGTIVNMAGRAVGPAIAAVYLSSYAFASVIWISVAALILALIIILLVLAGKLNG